MSAIPAARRYAPPTRIDPAAVSLINRLACPRAEAAAIVEGLALRIAPAGVGLGDHRPAADEAEIVFVLDAVEKIALRLPAAIPDRIARAVQPDLDALPAGPAGAFLLELALAPLLDAAERIVGGELRIEAVAPAVPQPGAATLLLDGALGEDAFTASLPLLPAGPAAEAALALLRALARREVPLPEIGLPLAWEAGATRLSAGRIAGLARGDVVLPDLWHPRRREIRAVLGATHAAMAVRDAHRAKLWTAFRPIPAGPMAEGTDGMGQDTTTEDAGPGLDGVGLTLAFELGRRSVTLAELKDVGAGHVFDLGLPPGDSVDLVVNGTRIGRGEIVSIGERLGVRVVRLFGPHWGA